MRDDSSLEKKCTKTILKPLGAKLAIAAAIAAVTSIAIPAHAGEIPAPIQILNAGAAPRQVGNLRLNSGGPTCGVQFTGTIPGNSTQLYYTFDWNSANYVDWTVMSKTVYTGGSEVTLSNLATQRADATHATYWLTIVNNSPDTQNFQGRYCIVH